MLFEPLRLRELRSRSSAARVAPTILTVLRRPRSPRRISIADRRTPKAPASASITALFAAPSTGGDVTATRRRSPTAGPTAVRDARGTTCTSTIKAPSRSAKDMSKGIVPSGGADSNVRLAAREAEFTIVAGHSYLDQFVARGEVVGVGPFTDPAGGNMALFRTRAVAEAFVKADPFLLEGVVKAYQIKDWGDQMLS